MDVEKDIEDVGECVGMYLHNYTGDALGTDVPSVRVIGVSTLFSDTRQTQFFLCGHFGLSFLLLLDATLTHRLRFARYICQKHVFLREFLKTEAVLKSEIKFFISLKEYLLARKSVRC